ncbi:hypothetical protein DFH06DRAFT_1145908 [Mycena polygramma]|nr:hypothetical protein DFH06DRAFT_1145908 [Mycena polygramma]
MLAFLEEEMGYVVKRAIDVNYPDRIAIRRILWLCKDASRINLMFVEGNHPAAAVLQFHSTAVMNIVFLEGFLCLYPLLTLCKLSLMNGTNGDAYERERTARCYREVFRKRDNDGETTGGDGKGILEVLGPYRVEAWRDLGIRKPNLATSLYASMVDLAIEVSYSGMDKLIKALPPELKDVIFYHATGTGRLKPRDVGRQRLYLCLVCKDWKVMTYAVPRVWTCIDVKFKSGFEYDPVKTCLTNSGRTKLEIQVDMKSKRPKGEAFLHQYFRTAGPAFWTRAHFQHQLRRPWRIRSRNVVPQTNGLRGAGEADNLYQCGSRRTNNAPSRILSPLPSLKYLDCGSTLPPASVEFVAAAITELHLTTASRVTTWSEIRHTLSTFSHVERLRLANVGCTEDLTGPQIEFPSLWALMISFNNRRVIQLVQKLVMPSLRFLRLTICNAGEVTSFLSQCGTLLGTVTSADIAWRRHIDDDDCLAILNAFTGAQTLDFMRFVPRARPALIRALSNPELRLPKLSSIRMNWKVEDVQVGQILSGRVHEDCSLTTVEQDEGPIHYYTRVWKKYCAVDM